MKFRDLRFGPQPQDLDVEHPDAGVFEAREGFANDGRVADRRVAPSVGVAGMSRSPTCEYPASRAHVTMSGGASSQHGERGQGKDAIHVGRYRYTRSMIIAMPWPTPMHIVHSA